MCRWISYTGNSIALDTLLLKPDVSLIDQSLSARMSEEPTNGDGFGVGWFDKHGEPGVYRAIQPAWNDRNLCDLARHIESSMFIAHVRNSTGTPIQQTNCHPFRHGRWLFVHNGLIREFDRVKRDLLMEVAPELFPDIRGSTDSELLFYLALTFGLEHDPLPALERAVGLVEKIGRQHGVEHPLQMTLGLQDGARLFAVRYSSEGRSRSLFHSESILAMREFYPDPEVMDLFSDDARAVVSEPLSDLSGAWIEIPEATSVIVAEGRLEERPFVPRTP